MGRKARLKRERRLARENPGAASALDVRRRLATLGAAAVEAPSTTPKLSDALVEIARPVIAQLGPKLTEARFQALLTIALLAWNADLVPDHEKVVDDALRPIRDKADATELYGALHLMIERRRELYPNDRRIAAQVAVRAGTRPGDYSVTAAYASSPTSS